MTEIEAILAQHEGADHLAQPCKVGDFPCDIQTMAAEIERLRAELGEYRAALVEAIRQVALTTTKVGHC